MNDRLLIPLALAAVLAGALTAHGAEFTEEGRQALRLTSADIQAALGRSGLPKESPLALLPVKGDSSGYVIGVLKNAATSAGLTCVEGKEDPFLDEVWKEIAWDERKDGILDAETVAKFGRLKAAKLLLYAFVRDVSGGNGRGYAEFEVHVSSIETKQHLWGEVFARRYYDAQLPVGPVDLGPEVRQLVRGAFESLPVSLKAAPRLKDVRSVLLVPLAGDADRFVSGLAENALTSTPYTPKQLDVRTLAQARALLRDDPKAADAILYGAVRDLSRKTLKEYPDRVEYQLSASVQLTIQQSPAGEVLWSQTIEATGPYVLSYSWWEVLKRYGPFVLARKNYFLVPTAVVVALLVVAMFLRAMRRAR